MLAGQFLTVCRIEQLADVGLGTQLGKIGHTEIVLAHQRFQDGDAGLCARHRRIEISKLFCLLFPTLDAGGQ